MSKFLKFTERPSLVTKTKNFLVHSKKDNSALGEIHWYPSWKRYCFYPAANTIFDSKCLADIQNFIEKIK